MKFCLFIRGESFFSFEPRPSVARTANSLFKALTLYFELFVLAILKYIFVHSIFCKTGKTESYSNVTE